MGAYRGGGGVGGQRNKVAAGCDALGHTTSTQYDKLGQHVRLTDANGQTTTVGYDGLRRPRQR